LPWCGCINKVGRDRSVKLNSTVSGMAKREFGTGRFIRLETARRIWG
jgi:hypothetical protein